MSRCFPVLCVVACSIISGGCAAHAPHTYRLTSQLLVPPDAAGPDVTRRTIAVNISADRRLCPAVESGIEIRRRGKGARITVERAAIMDKPQGWLASWAVSLETRGCIPAGEGFKLAARIAESLPLPPSAAFRLLHMDYRQHPFQDLGPENRLQVDSPILRDGAPADAPAIESTKITGLTVEVKTSENLLGFETAWYAIRPKPAGYGSAIVPLYAESHIQGAVERSPEPRTNYFQFAPQAGFYRIFYRGDRTILFVSAPTPAELERETQALRENPGACATFPPKTCVMIPNKVGVNANITAMVNGREQTLPVGSNIADAIRAARVTPAESVLPQLTIRRPYDGKLTSVEFDRGSREILSLTLLGGEEISWQKP